MSQTLRLASASAHRMHHLLCLLCPLCSSDESDAAWDEGLTLADNLESNLTLVSGALVAGL